jgi:hypothetical protein
MYNLILYFQLLKGTNMHAIKMHVVIDALVDDAALSIYKLTAEVGIYSFFHAII